MTSQTPAVVTRYLKAAAAQDAVTLADCFTPDGTVVDEGRTYTGREEIRQWRAATASQWTYTTTVTGSEPREDGTHHVDVHAEGNFPGGVAELGYEFVFAGDLIAVLTIA